jgi:hypothetical protein
MKFSWTLVRSEMPPGSLKTPDKYARIPSAPIQSLALWHAESPERQILYEEKFERISISEPYASLPSVAAL